MPAYKDKKRNTWFVKFSYKNSQGERKYITKRGFTTKKAAMQYERDFLVQKSGSTDMTFSQFVQVYREDRKDRLRISTFETKDSIITQKLLPFFGNKPLRDISAKDVMLWQNQLLAFRDSNTGKPYSKSYLKTIHNQLSAILNHGVRFYGLPSNPASFVGNMGSSRDIQMRFWTREEYQRFAEYMMDDPIGYYYFEMLYWCGIREGEGFALTPADFDFIRNTVAITKSLQNIHGREIITDPKTPKSKRVISMPAFLSEEIQDYLRLNPQIGSNDRMFPLTKNYIHRKMTLGSQAQGLERIRIHDLRHSHVSLLIDMGYSAVAIAERMGHESIDITYRYAHLFPTVQKQMANDLNELGKGMVDTCN